MLYIYNQTLFNKNLRNEIRSQEIFYYILDVGHISLR